MKRISNWLGRCVWWDQKVHLGGRSPGADLHQVCPLGKLKQLSLVPPAGWFEECGAIRAIDKIGFSKIVNKYAQKIFGRGTTKCTNPSKLPPGGDKNQRQQMQTIRRKARGWTENQACCEICSWGKVSVFARVCVFVLESERGCLLGAGFLFSFVVTFV